MGKKFNIQFPPPPPPEIPAPDSSMSESPAGSQQYSPSRATSPNSDDDEDLPPPPTIASLPPRKVLKTDQAKKRLQAFAKSKLVNSPKVKSASAFNEEDDQGSNPALVKELKSDRKKYPTVKEATPVMASIMKEEVQSRDLVQKNMERKNKEDDVDLRDLLNLRKKRDSVEPDAGMRRSRSRERTRQRRKSGDSSTDKNANRKDEDDSSSSQDRSRSKRRRESSGKVDMFEESPEDSKRRRRGSGDSVGRKRIASGEKRQRNISGDKRRSGSFLDERKRNKSKFRDESPGKKLAGTGRKRRSSGDSSRQSCLGSPGSASGKKKLSKEEKWNMPDLMDEMKKEKEGRKDIDLWELRHGKKEADVEVAQSPPSPPAPKLFQIKKKKNGLVLIKANSDEDYYSIKQAKRDPTDASNLVDTEDGDFLEYPFKFMKETSDGVCFCYNPEVSKEIFVEAKKSAKIRKSIDSMMFELENETKKKQQSRDNSIENPDISKIKKKKKLKPVVEKKDKKKKKVAAVDAAPVVGKKKKKLKVKKEKVDVKSELTKLAQVDNVPLSAAGMSKLYSMAGYAAVGKPEVEVKKKDAEEEAPLPPVTPKKPVKEEKIEEKYDPCTPLQDDTEYGDNEVSRSPSPNLIADLNRISDRNDDGPRLPKMKDSRSPSKVPIMRDGRSPLKERKSFLKESPVKKDQEKHRSPRASEIPRNESPGIEYDPIRDSHDSEFRDRDQSYSSQDKDPRDNQNDRSRRLSPGRPLEGSGDKVFSPKSETSGRMRRASRSPRGKRTPSPRNKHRYSEREKNRGRSPVNDRERRPFTPERDQMKTNKESHHSPGRYLENSKEPESRVRKSVSPGRRLASPIRSASPSRRSLSPRKDRKSPRRDSPRGPRRESPRGKQLSPRRAATSRRSPRRRSFSPSRRSKSPNRRPASPRRKPISPDRKYDSPSSSRKPKSPDRRQRSPERKQLSPERKQLSPERKQLSPERR